MPAPHHCPLERSGLRTYAVGALLFRAQLSLTSIRTPNLLIPSPFWLRESTMLRDGE